MKTKVNLLALLFTFVAWPLLAQFNLHLTTSFASTRYFPSTNQLNNFPDKISLTIGAEIEYKIRGSKKGPIYLALRSGVSYQQAGYDYVNVLSINNTQVSSTLDKNYLKIPLLARVYFQPYPLVDEFTLFIGGGVSINKVLGINLKEKDYNNISDNANVIQYSKSQYLFSVVDLGLAYKRLQIVFRIQSSLEGLYLNGLQSKWKVPKESSAYFSRHDSGISDESSEKILELMFSYRLF